jgi:hypothetical protein
VSLLKQAVIRPCIVPMHVGVRPREAVIRRDTGAITTNIIGSIKMPFRASIGSGSRTTRR